MNRRQFCNRHLKHSRIAQIRQWASWKCHDTFLIIKLVIKRLHAANSLPNNAQADSSGLAVSSEVTKVSETVMAFLTPQSRILSDANIPYLHSPPNGRCSTGSMNRRGHPWRLFEF